MLALNNVNVMDQTAQPKSRDIADWPLLDSRGNSLDDIGRPKKQPERNAISNWERQRTPETDDENPKQITRAVPRMLMDDGAQSDEDELSEEDDLDGEEEEMRNAIRNKMGNPDRNYMYPEHAPARSDPAKPPMLKFKASLFSRNVLVVNRALKKFMNKGEEGREKRKKLPEEMPREEMERSDSETNSDHG